MSRLPAYVLPASAWRSGCSSAFITLRAMRSVLYGVGVYDAPSLLAVLGTLAAVTLLAATIPALSIASIDPANTLREE